MLIYTQQGKNHLVLHIYSSSHKVPYTRVTFARFALVTPASSSSKLSLLVPNPCITSSSHSFPLPSLTEFRESIWGHPGLEAVAWGTCHSSSTTDQLPHYSKHDCLNNKNASSTLVVLRVLSKSTLSTNLLAQS